MSPALLHYTQRGISWECGTFFTREDDYCFRTDPLIKGIVIKPDLTGVGDFFVWNSLVVKEHSQHGQITGHSWLSRAFP